MEYSFDDFLDHLAEYRKAKKKLDKVPDNQLTGGWGSDRHPAQVEVDQTKEKLWDAFHCCVRRAMESPAPNR